MIRVVLTAKLGQKVDCADALMADDGAHILLVSGDGLERTALGEYLRGCGFHVVEAVDGDEATLALDHTPIDIVVSDVQLRHHGSGRSLSALVKRRHPDVKMIVNRLAMLTPYRRATLALTHFC